MRLENTLALIHGELINTPFVNSFNNVVFDVKAIKRGDLFIAYDEESIEDAILNGAYGIVFDKPTQITDSEIAWIKVESLDDALKRLLRFELISKEVSVYSCDEIVLKLALQVVTETNFIALEGNIRSTFKELLDIQDGTTILFSPVLTSADLFTNIKSIPQNTMQQISIIEQTLFETSFIYDDVFYERQLISPFFMPYLEQLLYLFKILKINFRLKKFTPIDHFKAIFTNKKFEIKEFGTSDKVLIFEKSTSLIEKEIEFLHKQATWAKIIYIVPAICQEKLPGEFAKNKSLLIYKNQNEIKNLLKTNNFHFALIIGVDESILAKPLVQNTQMSLFDFK